MLDTNEEEKTPFVSLLLMLKIKHFFLICMKYKHWTKTKFEILENINILSRFLSKSHFFIVPIERVECSFLAADY